MKLRVICAWALFIGVGVSGCSPKNENSLDKENFPRNSAFAFLQNPALQARTTPEFTFDRFAKHCLNPKDQEGLNPGYFGECGDLKDLNLSSQNFSKTVFKGADLSGSLLRGTNLGQTDLRGTNLWFTDWEGADFRGALFSDRVSTWFRGLCFPKRSRLVHAFNSRPLPSQQRRRNELCGTRGYRTRGLSQNSLSGYRGFL